LSAKREARGRSSGDRDHEQAKDHTKGALRRIDRALATEGGHLAIGRGGCTPFLAEGSRLSGHDCETIKAEGVAAGLTVIDSQRAAFEQVADLAIGGPMVAVGSGRSGALPFPVIRTALIHRQCVPVDRRRGDQHEASAA